MNFSDDIFSKNAPIRKKILVICHTLRHFQEQINIECAPHRWYKLGPSEFVIDHIAYKYVSGARMLRGIKNIDRIEIWYGAELRSDFNEIQELISYKKATGDIKEVV